jgi:hypothetical protein
MLFKILLWKKIFVFTFIIAKLGPQIHQNEIQKQKGLVAYQGVEGGKSISIQNLWSKYIMARAWG